MNFPIPEIIKLIIDFGDKIVPQSLIMKRHYIGRAELNHQ